LTGYWAVSIAVAVYVTLVFAVAFTVRTKPHDPGGEWPTDEYAAVQTRAERLREPFVSGAPVPPPVRVHSQCLDVWADGKRPCGRCETILGVRT
jgi:hypothetical protein